MFSEWSSKRIEELIKCCGGHGYSNYSGLPTQFTENFPNQILEGENSVLLLQVTRYLVKSLARVQAQKVSKVNGFVSFLKDISTHLSDETDSSIPASGMAGP